MLRTYAKHAPRIPFLAWFAPWLDAPAAGSYEFLRRCAGPELLARTNLRKERILETSTAPELLQTAGDLPSCRECGAIPYLSYVRCSCR